MIFLFPRPNFDGPEEMFAVGGGLVVKENDLIFEDMGCGRDRAALHNCECGIIFQPGSEVNALVRQLYKTLVMGMAPLHDYHRATYKPESSSQRLLAIGIG
jgi:hypothetical protein